MAISTSVERNGLSEIFGTQRNRYIWPHSTHDQCLLGVIQCTCLKMACATAKKAGHVSQIDLAEWILSNQIDRKPKDVI